MSYYHIPWNVIWGKIYPQIYNLSSNVLLQPLQIAFDVHCDNTLSEFFTTMNNRQFFTGEYCAERNIAILLGLMAQHVEEAAITTTLKVEAAKYFGLKVLVQYEEVLANKRTIQAQMKQSTSVNVYIHNNPPAAVDVDNSRFTVLPGTSKQRLIHPSAFIDTDMGFIFAIPSLPEYRDGITFTASITICDTVRKGKVLANKTFNNEMKDLKDKNEKATPNDLSHGYMVARYAGWIGAQPEEDKDYSMKLPSKQEKEKKETDNEDG